MRNGHLLARCSPLQFSKTSQGAGCSHCGDRSGDVEFYHVVGMALGMLPDILASSYLDGDRVYEFDATV